MKKRADGLYVQSIYLGKDENGKPRRKSFYGKTQKEVHDKAAEWQKSRTEISAKFCDISARFLSYEEQRITYPRLKSKRARLALFVQEFGDKNITDILPKDIQTVVDRIAYSNPRTGQPTARQTLQQYISAVSDVFNFAIQNRITTVNPCAFVSIPKTAVKNTRVALTEEERLKIQNCDSSRVWVATFLMYTGLRIGEATALTWKDVNLSEKTITVNKSFNFKETETKTTKTESGNRSVPIPNILIPILKQHKSTGYVIKSQHGTRMTEQAWRSLRRTLTRASGVNFEWHQLRHTYASILYTAGVDVLTACKILGHADVKTTMSIYTHLEESKKKLSIDRLNDYLNR